MLFPYLWGTMTTSVKLYWPFSSLKWQCSSKVHLCLWLFCQSPGGSVVKNLPTVWELQEMWVRSLGWEDPLEEGTATHSSILAWRIPWTEDTGRIWSIGSQRDRQYWSDLAQHQLNITKFMFFLVSCKKKKYIYIYTHTHTHTHTHRSLFWAVIENFYLPIL